MNAAKTDLRVDLSAVLPDAPDGEDACVARLSSGLLEREGIASVHVVPAEGRTPAQLCIHYLSDVIALRRIRELTAALGTRLTDEIGHLAIETQGIDRPARAGAIEARLRGVDGVLEAHVAPTGAVNVEFDRTRTTEIAILAMLRRSGVTSPPGDSAPAVAVDHEGLGTPCRARPPGAPA